MAFLDVTKTGKYNVMDVLTIHQVIICTVSEVCEEYARELQGKILGENFFVDLNLEGEKIEKKIRNAQTSQYNYILVVGPREMAEGTVNVRTRDNVVHGSKTVDELLTEWKNLIADCE